MTEQILIFIFRQMESGRLKQTGARDVTMTSISISHASVYGCSFVAICPIIARRRCEFFDKYEPFESRIRSSQSEYSYLLHSYVLVRVVALCVTVQIGGVLVTTSVREYVFYVFFQISKKHDFLRFLFKMTCQKNVKSR